MRLRRLIPIALAVALFGPVPAHAAQLTARMSADRIEPGSSVGLEVRVTDFSGQVGQPQLTLPDGLQLLGVSQSQSFQWINGRSSNQIVYRLEIEALDPGRYVVGPVRVDVGSQPYLSDALTLVVAAAPSLGGARSGPATLSIALEPPAPYVGQLCRLSVRLLQRATLAEDSEYDPPALPGFWTESWSDPSGYEARESGRRVQVVERAIRLYPLAIGPGTIGRARAVVTPATSSLDPIFGGAMVAGQRVRIASGEIPVNVRALPPGAPAGFDGAVGDFQVRWSSDRSHTAEDQPVSVFLDIRGTGNLPLLKPPPFAGPGFEVFASTSDDSLAPAGSMSPGRKRFQWTVLPRGGDRIEIPAPVFSWFEPATGQYRTAQPPPLEVHIEKAGLASSDDRGGFPAALWSRPPAPARRGPQPWALALAGAAAAGVVVALRRHRQPAPDSAERARQREWVRAVSRATGPDFWRAADEAVAWSEFRGSRVLRLREEIAAARFGGSSLPEQDVRRRVLERLKEALPEPQPEQAGAWIGIALALGGVGLVCVALGLGGLPDARWRARAAAADREARAGHLDAAASEWRALWGESHHPGFAARLAWNELNAGHTGPAAAWVIAGDARAARRAEVGWVLARVREAGGLTGARGRLVPLTRLEWGLLAFAMMFAAGWVWPRRRQAVLLATMALVCALAPTLEDLRMRWPPQRVVGTETAFADGSLTLDAGQVVDLLSISGDTAHVRASAGLDGRVPAAALLIPGSTP